MQQHKKEALSAAVEIFSKAHILCIGDLMLDTFVYGEVERLSPEAPVPVLSVSHENTMPGGAGNVLRNVIALGAEASFISVIGDDRAGTLLTSLIGQEKRAEPYLITERGRISPAKTRYVSRMQQLLRVDCEKAAPISEATEKKAIGLLESIVPQAGIVVLSDYAKGTLTDALIRAVIQEAGKHGIPVIVDPKRKDCSVYSGAAIITPNALELSDAVRLPVKTDEEVVKAAHALMTQHDFECVLVTRGRQGMTLVPKKGEATHFPAVAQEIFDVSGAGDTVIATLAVALGSGMGHADAAYLSNLAAGIVVTRIGTSIVHRTDLKTALFTHDVLSGTRKILPREDALRQVKQWRGNGLTIGFTNGCFDLIHPGHVSLLAQAKAACDWLVIGLNSDDSVRRLKGEARPVQNEMARALVLASLEAVDAITIFREDTPIALIESIRPDVLVKGADYAPEEVVGGDFVRSYGGTILLADIAEGQSTTRLIRKSAN